MAAALEGGCQKAPRCRRAVPTRKLSEAFSQYELANKLDTLPFGLLENH